MKTDDIALKTFDYELIDPDTKGKLICLAGEINRAAFAHIEFAMKMGEAIATAHELLAEAGCHGKFKPWIEKECGISRSTAYVYMNSWNSFGKCPGLGQFTNEGMYLLAGPGVPELAKEEAMKKAGKGIRITKERAIKILGTYTVAKKPKPAANGKPPAEAAKPPEPPKPPAAEPAAKAAEKPTTKISPDFIAAGDIKAGEVVYTDLNPGKPETFELSAEETDADILDFNPAKLEAAPAATVNIKALAGPYKMAVLEIGRIVREFTALASVERTGVHLADKITRITHDLTEAREAISQSEPVQPCGKCNGAGCKACFQSGFWTRAIVGSRKR